MKTDLFTTIPLILIIFGGFLNCQRIINNSYKKSIYFAGSVVREDHLIDLEVADESPKPSNNLPKEMIEELHQNWFPNYVFVVPPSQSEQLTSWEARLIPAPSNPEPSPLSISEITSDVSSCQR